MFGRFFFFAYLCSMKELGIRNHTLIVPVIREVGTFNPNEILFWFEERLYTHEVYQIERFLDWCHETKQSVYADINELFKIFLPYDKKNNN